MTIPTDTNALVKAQYIQGLQNRGIQNTSTILVCCQCGNDIVNETMVIPIKGPLAWLAMHKRCAPEAGKEGG